MKQKKLRILFGAFETGGKRAREDKTVLAEGGREDKREEKSKR